MANGEKALIYSKEMWMTIITFIVAMIVQTTGIVFPLTPEQIFGAGMAIVLIIRIGWTKSNITSVLPKK